MLDNQTIATVKSTLPLLTATGPKLTAHFYERMFSHNPELKDIFNMNNQRNGDQREALFAAICAYAANIDNLAALLPAVQRIAEKHASFNVQPAQYAVVGEHLLATLDEMFSPGEEVLTAWGKAYGVLAQVFVQHEEGLYQQSAQQPGGWRGVRPFRITKKQQQSSVITSFTLEPEDGKPVADYLPGQYLALYIRHPSMENQEIRHYSLTDTPNGNSYRIAVKREDHGIVSQYLHNLAQEGDIIDIAPPHGEFVLEVKPDTPVALISAGVGQTPMLGMLHSLLAQKHRAALQWLHAAENGQAHAFGAEVTSLSHQLPQLQQHIWYREPLAGDIAGQDYHSRGLMDLAAIPTLTSNPQQQYYLCGPLAFMQSVAKQLIAQGVPTEQLHYECFGPHKVI